MAKNKLSESSTLALERVLDNSLSLESAIMQEAATQSRPNETDGESNLTPV